MIATALFGNPAAEQRLRSVAGEAPLPTHRTNLMARYVQWTRTGNPTALKAALCAAIVIGLIATYYYPLFVLGIGLGIAVDSWFNYELKNYKSVENLISSRARLERTRVELEGLRAELERSQSDVRARDQAIDPERIIREGAQLLQGLTDEIVGLGLERRDR